MPREEGIYWKKYKYYTGNDEKSSVCAMRRHESFQSLEHAPTFATVLFGLSVEGTSIHRGNCYHLMSTSLIYSAFCLTCWFHLLKCAFVSTTDRHHQAAVRGQIETPLHHFSKRTKQLLPILVLKIDQNEKCTFKCFERFGVLRG